MSLVYGSVCSGIEAASAAWHPLGWRAAFFAEIDPFPSAVLAHRFPETPNLGDFTKIEASPEPVDVLVGGTPCQSFSVAGLRGGMADDRGNLALEFLRLAGRLRPDWLVWENVPGVLSSSGGRDFGAFLGGLVELGYGFAYRVLDAQYVRVDGFGRAVPQRRRRVFVVGSLGDWRRAAAVFFERESLCGNPAPRREAGSDVARSLMAGSESGSAHRYDLETENFVACTLQASNGGVSSGYHPVVPVAHSLRADGFDASEDGTGRGTPLIPVPYIVNAAESCAVQSHARRSEVARCIDSTGSFANAQGGTVVVQPVADPVGTPHEHHHAVAFQERGRDGGRSVEWQEDLAYSLNAPNGGGRRHELNVLWRWAVRRLTPRECERLQGFPDDFTLVPYRGKPASDGPRYKAVGNSMAIPPMRWLGHRINLVNARV